MDSYCSTLLPNQRVLSVNILKVILSFSLFVFFLFFGMSKHQLPTYHNVPVITFLVRLNKWLKTFFTIFFIMNKHCLREQICFETLQCLCVVCRIHSCCINWNKWNTLQITGHLSLASLTRKEKLMVQMVSSYFPGMFGIFQQICINSFLYSFINCFFYSLQWWFGLLFCTAYNSCK